MAFESFFISIFANLAHDQLKRWFKDHLGKQLTRTCKTWLKELPQELQCQPEALFNINHEALKPHLARIRQTLKDKQTPTGDDWAHLFKARWRLALSEHDGPRQPLFEADEEQIFPHFDDLGQRLLNTCRENSELFQTTLAKLMDEMHDDLKYIRHKVNQLQPPEPPSVEHKPLRLPDDIPPIRPLPPGSLVRYGSAFLLIGRDEALKQIAARFSDQDGHIKPRLTILTGMGGLGKTHLANAFVHHYGHHFPGGVFWLSFAEAGQVAAEVAACVNLPNATFGQRVQAVCRQWIEGPARLLVFDNCEDAELLDAWLPKSGPSRVLVTSRKSDWKQPNTLQLTTLNSEQGAEVLQDLCERLDRDMAKEISKTLGGLPLALHLAGSFLDHYSMDPKKYLAAVQQDIQHVSLQGRGAQKTTTEHELHLARTFEVSFHKLSQKDDATALALLARAACFAPGEPLPTKLLPASLAEADELDAQDGLHRLKALGLLERVEEDQIRLHRLLASYVQDVVDTKEAQTAVEVAVIDQASEDNQSGYPQRLTAWRPHLTWVTEQAKNDPERRATLHNELGYHLNAIGDHRGAKPFYQEALDIRRTVLGDRHPKTANSLNNMGSLLDSMGELADARPFFQEALDIHRSVLGDRHPKTGTSLNNMGFLLQAMGELADARPFFQEALDICRSVLGDRHPKTATSLNNMGALLDSMGESADARPFFQEALDIHRSVLSDRHPDTATSLNNMGALLQAMGELAEARPFYQEALDIRRAVLGDRHPDTAQSLNNMGFLLQAMGELTDARTFYQEALDIRRAVLGDRHPDTAQSLNNMGFLLRAMGELADTRPFYQEALDIRRAVLGDRHPDTAQSLNNMAGLLQAMGELSEAEPFYVEAVAIFEDRLGLDHPNTKVVRNNLADLQQKLKT